MELQNWAGAMHDNTLKALELAEAKEGGLTEMDVSIAGMSQEAVDNLEEMDKRLYQFLVAYTKRRGHITTSAIRGSIWSVTSTQEQVQTGLLYTRG